MFNIALVKLGNFRKFRLDLSAVQRWPSKVLHVVSIHDRAYAPDGQQDWQHFQDNDLGRLVPAKAGADITVVITEYGLEDNFYMRRLGPNVMAMSLHEVGDCLEKDNIPLENFVIRNLYSLAILFHLYKELPPPIPPIFHDETRGCLFDINGLKTDVAFSMEQPRLCELCEAELLNAELPAGLVQAIKHELCWVRKPFYYRLLNFMKRRPLLSLAIGSAFAILLNMIASWIYDLLKVAFQGNGTAH